MKKSYLLMAGVAALSLAACNKTANEVAADNIEANVENVADNLEMAADNAGGTAEDTLDNQADALRKEGDRKADTIDDKNINSATPAQVNAM